MKKFALFLGLMLAGASARATVVSQNISATFTCTGTTGPFAFTFSISAANAITVNQNGTALSPTAYVVTPVNNNYDNGGSVTLNAACPNAQTLTITRTTPLTQNTVFTDNMPVPMKSFENGLDKLTEIAQELGATKGGTGSVNSVAVANANGFEGTVLNPNTNPTISISVDSTHVLPTNTGNGSTFLNSAGTYSTLSGGGLPSGSQYQIQTNGGSSTFGHSNAYTDATGNPLTVPGALTGQTTNGTVNSDVVGNVALTLTNPLCTTAGCFFARPQTSSDTATIANLFTSSLVNIHASDLKFGSQADYFWNTTAPSYMSNDDRFGRSTFCGWTTAYQNLIGARTCGPQNFIYAPFGGQYVRGQPSNGAFHYDQYWNYSRSIGQNIAIHDYFDSIGDKAMYRGYLYHRSGAIAGSDESIEGNGLDIISQSPPSGTVTTGGAGATALKINFTSNAGNQADGLELIDEADVIDSGHYVGAITVGAGNAPSTIQTVDINGNAVSHTVSSGIATLTAACGATTVRNQPASATCSVTVNSGAFTSGGTNFVCVADWHYYEQAAITATGSGTLTLNLAYSHPSGTQIFQGAGCGGRLVLGNGSAPLSTAQITSYAVAGAPDATHYAVIVKYLGGQNGNLTLPWGQINPLIAQTYTIGPLTRSANVVTAPIDGAPAWQFNNYTAPGSSAITIAGTTPSDFNGAITGVTYDPQAQTLSWNQAGINETASTYSTIALVGANNFSIYCGAETTAIGGVTVSAAQTPVLDGTMQVEPNGCTWTSGDAVIQPNGYNEHFASDERGVGSDPSDLMPLSTGNSSKVYLSLSGPASSGFIFNDLPSGDPPSKFLGHGGLYIPYTYTNLQGGVFDYFASILYAPDIALFNIGCPADGCSATSMVDNLFTISGNSGQGKLGFDTHNSTWLFNNPVSAPNSSVTGQQVGIEGTFGGIPLNNTLFTQTLGHNYSSWGSGNTGDSTSLIGAGEFAAGTIMAGAAIPTNGFVAPQGTAGTTSYSYVCTAVSASGGETLPNASFNTTTGNATLNATNYNRVVCLGNVGDQTMNVYRSTNGGGLATGLICSAVPVNRTNEFCNDTGQAAGAAVPTTDTSGRLSLGGKLVTGIAGTGLNLQSVGTSTNGYLPMFGAGGLANSHCDDGATTAGIITCTEPIKVAVTYPNSLSLGAGTGNIPALAANTAGFAAPASGGTSWLGKLPATITAGLLHFGAPATGDGVNESAITSAPVGLASADVSGVLPIANGGTGVQGAEVVTFSATPTFSTSFGVSRIVLTGNVTSFTLGAGVDGQAKQLCFEQDATGSRTVAAPANVHGFFTVGATASKWSCQSFTYDNTDSIWLATSPGVTNE